jgi:hypothetical protein
MNQPSQTGGTRRMVMVAIAAVTLVAAGWLLFGSSDSEAARNRLGYFYDADAGKLIVAEDNGDNAQAIRAMVFACGSCEDDATQFIGWLESTSPDHDASQPRVIPSSNDSGYRIAPLPREPGGTLQWAARTEQSIAAMRHAAQSRCDGDALSVCNPQ